MLKTVTISGADDIVDHAELLRLSEKFPFVEWGILISTKREGTPRYPSRDWIKDLVKHFDLNLSGHLCGQQARNIVNDGNPEEILARDELKAFKRFQLNFTSLSLPSLLFVKAIKSLNENGQDVIIQLKSPIIKYSNEIYLKDCWFCNLKTFGFFDSSGGEGVAPIDWPINNQKRYISYAGGLGTDNLKTELKKIASAAGNNDFWIDTETKVRTDNKLNLEIVEEFLTIADEYRKGA